jgi:hypothetical protein
MAFQKTRLSPQAKEQIRAWALPDDILKDVYLHLTEVLPKDPEHNLSRESSPFDGMVTHFTRRDPYTRGREYEFTFLAFTLPEQIRVRKVTAHVPHALPRFFK